MSLCKIDLLMSAHLKIDLFRPGHCPHVHHMTWSPDVKIPFCFFGS